MDKRILSLNISFPSAKRREIFLYIILFSVRLD